MDLSQFDTPAFSEAGAVLHIEGPDGTPLMQDDGVSPVTITLLGSDSPTYRNAELRLARAHREFKIVHGGIKIDRAQAEANRSAVMAACTRTWSGIDYRGTADIPCTKANAMMLYQELPWLREQVDTFIHDRANYMGEASRNS